VSAPVLLIAWDSAEPSILQQGMDEGWLPALRDLRGRGRAYDVDGSHRDYPGAVWPNAITGTDIPQHGVYMDRQLVPGTYRLEELSAADLRRPPLWRHVSDAGLRTVVAGIYAMPILDDFDGVQAGGWGVADPYWTAPEPAIHPPEWRERLDAVAGSRIVKLRKLPTTHEELRSYRDRIVQGTKAQCAGLDLLMRETEWDLFCAGFGEPHQAGHLLWHTEDPTVPGHDEVPEDLRGSLRDLYRALDESLARLLDAAPPDARVLLLSPHGMGAQPTLGDPLGAILERGGWLKRPAGTGRATGKGLAKAAWRVGRRLTTRRIRTWLGRWLPRDRWHLSLWLGAVDWGETRAFPLFPDHLSFLRVNLAGREPEGIVPQGERDALCDEISEALLELRDTDSGERVVEEVVRPADRFGGAGAEILPDLAVRWATTRATTRVGSTRLGTIEMPLEQERTGMHLLPGMLVAAGPGIPPDGGAGLTGPEVSVLDLAPTLLGMLGVNAPHELAGRAVPGIPV